MSIIKYNFFKSSQKKSGHISHCRSLLCACCFAFLPMQCVQVKQQQAAPFHTWMCRAHRLTEGRSHKDRLCCCHLWICSASEEIDFNSGHYVYQVCANISMKVSVFLILAIVWETGEHVKKKLLFWIGPKEKYLDLELLDPWKTVNIKSNWTPSPLN